MVTLTLNEARRFATLEVKDPELSADILGRVNEALDKGRPLDSLIDLGWIKGPNQALLKTFVADRDKNIFQPAAGKPPLVAEFKTAAKEAVTKMSPAEKEQIRALLRKGQEIVHRGGPEAALGRNSAEVRAAIAAAPGNRMFSAAETISRRAANVVWQADSVTSTVNRLDNSQYIEGRGVLHLQDEVSRLKAVLGSGPQILDQILAVDPDFGSGVASGVLRMQLAQLKDAVAQIRETQQKQLSQQEAYIDGYLQTLSRELLS